MTLTTFWKDFASQNLSFVDHFFMDFSCFFRNPSRRALLAPKTPIYARKVDFWTPVGFPGVPKSAFGRPFSAKKSTFRYPAEWPSASGKRPCAERPSKTDFYRLFLIFGRFGTVFGWILHHFPRFFVGFASISRPHCHP